MVEERVQKILARAGYGSRRASEVLISEGRVTVNGKKIELGAKADIAVDRVAVDGSVIAKLPEFRYVAYNKPRFMLCDKTLPGDERRTVFDAVPGGLDMAVVGRLDFESEGLVILTNDGDLVNKLTHPRYEHEKEYRVLLSTKPDNAQLETWRRGIVLEDGHRSAPAKVIVEAQAGKGTWLRVVMKEGRKRQIRETAKLLGMFVVKIIRVRIGAITLGSLKSGEFRDLSKDEVEGLKRTSNEPRTRRTQWKSSELKPRRSQRISNESKPEKSHRTSSESKPGRPQRTGSSRQQGKNPGRHDSRNSTGPKKSLRRTEK